MRRQLASDNYAGVCPEAAAALAEANRLHADSYGEDPWTAEAAGLVRRVFETDCQVFFVFNGTAANALALAALCAPYHGVLAHEAAHLETDECGAPELFAGGAKVIPVPGAAGKLWPADVERLARARSDLHYRKLRAVSIAQSTESGTLYTVAELRSLSATTRALGLKLHLDGARFANAVAALGVAPRELTWEAGVDVMSFGLTKDGLAAGEAVVFFDRALAADFEFRCKQAGQLASKMRFITAPWAAMLRGGAWLEHARHANGMAAELATRLRAVPGVSLVHPVESNAVFVRFPAGVAEKLWAKGWHFYDFAAVGGMRLMCAWDTQREDLDAFVADLSEAVR
jgi:threonine aldolase